MNFRSLDTLLAGYPVRRQIWTNFRMGLEDSEGLSVPNLNSVSLRIISALDGWDIYFGILSYSGFGRFNYYQKQIFPHQLINVHIRVISVQLSLKV